MPRLTAEAKQAKLERELANLKVVLQEKERQKFAMMGEYVYKAMARSETFENAVHTAIESLVRGKKKRELLGLPASVSAPPKAAE
ncbi:MAG: hypothetical protein AAFR73_12110 [Pseudomonadota bacterium]